MSYTKEKWFYNKRNSTLFEIRNQKEKLIAELESYERNKNIMGFDELESNAKLIAAAPELLEALNQIAQFSDIGNDFKAIVRMKSIAVDAIKKARE
jgi:hypothetical protein